ncbi:MAG: glycine zipper 2TM domain-containing protein [Alphaproteobacteria bacterium]
MKTKSLIALGAGAILLIGATAGASVYVMENMVDESPSSTKTSAQETVTFNQPQMAALPPCNDDNIVGKVVGGAAGGLAGSQIGSGGGKTAATIGGAVGGSLLGEEYIPTKNVTCR